jgi:chromosome segregation ATPase
MAGYGQFITSQDQKQRFMQAVNSPLPELKLQSATIVEHVNGMESEMRQIESQKTEIQGVQMSLERTLYKISTLEKRKDDLETEINETKDNLERLLASVRKMNKRKKQTLVDRIKAVFGVRKTNMKK